MRAVTIMSNLPASNERLWATAFGNGATVVHAGGVVSRRNGGTIRVAMCPKRQAAKLQWVLRCKR